MMRASTTTNVLPLEPEQQSLNSLRWLPFLILLAGAAVLLFFWNQLPERWAVHWGFRGEADGWASKTLFGVFGFLLIGILICSFLEGIARFIIANRETQKEFKISPEALRLLAHATAGFVRAVSIALAFMIVMIAIKLPFYPHYEPTFTLAAAFTLVFVAIGIGIARVSRSFRIMKRAGLLEGAKGWNGLFYSNPDDPRLWVEKLFGLGYTLNFAHRAALPILISMLGIPILVILTVLIAASR